MKHNIRYNAKYIQYKRNDEMTIYNDDDEHRIQLFATTIIQLISETACITFHTTI